MGTAPHYDRSGGVVATWCELPDGRKHGPYVEWWSRTQQRMRGQYQFGGRTGTWLSWARGGPRTREIEFWEGDVHGRARFWYESGHPWKGGEYRRNQEHGMWSWYHEGAGLSLQGSYISGKKHGIWKQWARDGSELGECSFDRGTGTEVVRFENGLMQSKIDYVDGLKHGEAVCWFSSGRRSYFQAWQHGRPAGRWITWDEAGNVVKVEEFTAHDIGLPEDTKVGADTQVFFRRAKQGNRTVVIPGSRLYAPDEATEIVAAEALQASALQHAAYVEGEVTEFREAKPDEPEKLQKFYRDRNRTLLRIEAFEDGRRAKTTFYRDGEPYRIQRWHVSGNLASEGDLVNLERNGIWTHWHDNGQRSFMGTYRGGRPHGRFERWDRDGEPIGRFELEDGTGTWYDWYDSGQLREEGGLREGLEHGLWTYYAESGEVSKVVDYEHGEVLAINGEDTIVG